MNMDEFIDALAKARHIQKLEQDVIARAISDIFAE